jgi:hypothetical protein
MDGSQIFALCLLGFAVGFGLACFIVWLTNIERKAKLYDREHR